VARKIQVRRGAKEHLPQLSSGEIGFAQDSEELFIGGANGNAEIAMKKYVDDKTAGAVGDIDAGTFTEGNDGTVIDGGVF
jgi:hypothetical protein